MERDIEGAEVVTGQTISTHTLTWSVTRPRDVGQQEEGHFNSHAHVERDYYTRYHPAYIAHFNSHAHVERDLLIFKDILFH